MDFESRISPPISIWLMALTGIDGIIGPFAIIIIDDAWFSNAKGIRFVNSCFFLHKTTQKQEKTTFFHIPHTRVQHKVLRLCTPFAYIKLGKSVYTQYKSSHTIKKIRRKRYFLRKAIRNANSNSPRELFVEYISRMRRGNRLWNLFRVRLGRNF